ncbi:hypothetical protein [Shewanella sp. NIFS-20-20]|uniref:pyroglutamyl-peptidase I family protein n=1 Tax=Shewanella sp. NIFS-20-20 TaxID=2853806 RepID=UPI001C48E758|nr:hypothetical protein [Shewanella sp. NIFS-20-20]MBV7314076.1 hypothetical protein [Shewanella sp. NIFS-20-20]
MLKPWCTLLFMLTMPSIAAPMLPEVNQVEEARLPLAQQSMPEVVQRYQAFPEQLQQLLTLANNELTLTQDTAALAKRLWQQAVQDVQSGHPDDRALYWARLAMRDTLLRTQAGFALAPWQQKILLTSIEQASRGVSDVSFAPQSQVRLLVTGFDPFFLDKHIDQSNPSGLAALMLDGHTFTINGQQAEIQTLMIPVRFEDFDRAMIEALLTPYFRDNSVDMVITVSMGRDNFDLERFVGRQRSAAAPDNRNILTGASHAHPQPPLFENAAIKGQSFYEFSLPATAMTQVSGPWAVQDNRQVRTLEQGQIHADALSPLLNQTSVEGSGGGYLSNEITYRALRIKDLLNSQVRSGHIHTPRVQGYDRERETAIVTQLTALIHAAAAQ